MLIRANPGPSEEQLLRPASGDFSRRTASPQPCAKPSQSFRGAEGPGPRPASPLENTSEPQRGEQGQRRSSPTAPGAAVPGVPGWSPCGAPTHASRPPRAASTLHTPGPPDQCPPWPRGRAEARAWLWRERGGGRTGASSDHPPASGCAQCPAHGGQGTHATLRAKRHVARERSTPLHSTGKPAKAAAMPPPSHSGSGWPSEAAAVARPVSPKFCFPAKARAVCVAADPCLYPIPPRPHLTLGP